MGWLRGQSPKLQKDGTPRKPRRSGDPNRTFFNKVNDVVIFLSAHGINRLLKKSEYPKFAEKPVVYYDAEQVNALYAAAKNDEERFTLDYFLKSGVRDGEAAHAEFADVKGGFLNIVDKPHYLESHARRVAVPRLRIIYGYHGYSSDAVLSSNRITQICREGRNSTLAREVVPDNCYPHWKRVARDPLYT